MGSIVGEDLAVALTEVARTLQDERDESDTLHAITSAAVDTVPGAEYAGGDLRPPGSPAAPR